MRFRHKKIHKKIGIKHKVFATIYATMIFALVFSAFLNTNRNANIVVNGQELDYETTMLTYDAVLDELSDEMDLEDPIVEGDDGLILNDENTLEITTLKHLNITFNDQEYEVETYNNTLNEYLNSSEFKELNIENYIYDGDDQAMLEDNTDIHLIYVEEKEETKDVSVDQDIVKVDDDTLYEGTEQTVITGQPQITTTTYKVTYYDGVEQNREVINEEVTQEAIDTQINVGTKEIVEVEQEATTTSSSSGVWDQMAACESGGNWSINTGNGYYGGLQMNPTSWSNIAPTLGITASLPSEASKEEQIAVAEVMLANSGWGQWPACSSKLGLY